MPASPQRHLALRSEPDLLFRPERGPLLRGLAFAVPASLLAWGVILAPFVLPFVAW